ncbi:WYL domain-containing protein [Pedobacter agri]|uniref:WYL domain-containing protein n=1 Tax=Pedobacter agri TaxID=454586 RepID=UPI002931C7D0|nr:WYL domain-containing protein [Pedobacter agri]
MESKLFNIGDVVALSTHPYFDNGFNVILSADHLLLSPLMVISEIHKSTFTFRGKKEKTFKYKCLWFSNKTNTFEHGEIEESDLKLVLSSETTINKNFLTRGQRVAFKSTQMELGKKKSSLSYDDTTITEHAGSSTISSLLTFLPPIMQVVDILTHISRHQIENKAKEEIRKVVSFDVKLNYFDPTNDKLGEVILPLESLELIQETDVKTLKLLNLAIKVSRHLLVNWDGKTTILKPRNLGYRSGQYFLRGYDLLSNSIEEFAIMGGLELKPIRKPIIKAAPSFNIKTTPAAATPTYIENEIIALVNDAKAYSSYIRIKYKNRNDKISHRTIKNYEIISVNEIGKDVSYLIGNCLLRHDNRSFRVDRIQSIEQLNLLF